MMDLLSREEAIAKIEKATCEDGFREGTGLIHKKTVYEILRSLVSSKNPDILNLQENKSNNSKIFKKLI